MFLEKPREKISARRLRPQRLHNHWLSAWNDLRFAIDESVQPDVIGTLTEMSSVSAESVEATFSAQNIEHKFYHDVQVDLAEFLRELKPYGSTVITCPDLQAVCALIAQDNLTEPACTSRVGPVIPLDIHYDHRSAMNTDTFYIAHRCGFTEKVRSTPYR